MLKNETELKIDNKKVNWFNNTGVYLIEVLKNEISSYDGVHSSKKDVEKAYYLWKRLGFVKKDREYFLLQNKNNTLTLKKINQNQKFKLNEEAVGFCKMALDSYKG